MGLVAPSSYLAINSYFVARRGLVMGLCQAGIGLGFIVVPYLVEAMLRNYGFRGTMLLLGGISLNSIVGALLYQPVEWHSIRLRLHKTIMKEDEKGKRLVIFKKEKEICNLSCDITLLKASCCVPFSCSASCGIEPTAHCALFYHDYSINMADK
jgi:MFS family permease